jgi:hypothetical protein
VEALRFGLKTLPPNGTRKIAQEKKGGRGFTLTRLFYALLFSGLFTIFRFEDYKVFCDGFSK